MKPWQTLTQILTMNTFEKEEAYKKRVVFLSGKVTGLPRPWIIIKFGWYSFWLSLLRYEVKNPVKLIPKTWNWQDSMTLCLSVINTCDSIFMIPGWRKSKGAKKEFKEAAKHGLTCLNSGKTKWLFDTRKMMCECDREMEGDRRLLNDLKLL
jgi:Domain of unknown function (DUF4406)